MVYITCGLRGLRLYTRWAPTPFVLWTVAPLPTCALRVIAYVHESQNLRSRRLWICLESVSVCTCQVQQHNTKNWSERLLSTCNVPNVMRIDVPNAPMHYYTCQFKRSKLSRYGIVACLLFALTTVTLYSSLLHAGYAMYGTEFQWQSDEDNDDDVNNNNISNISTLSSYIIAIIIFRGSSNRPWLIGQTGPWTVA